MLVILCSIELLDIDKIIDLRFYIEPGSEGAHSRHVVILGDHMVDSGGIPAY
jgi:hypothetical protein